jgi:hypothetical protein
LGRLNLYRSLVVENDTISVVVDLDRGDGFAPRLIHRGRCRLPQGVDEVAERVQGLLGDADRAVAKLIERAADEGISANDNRRVETPSEAHQTQGAWQGRAAQPRPDTEHRIRERAYFLWEGAGRPSEGAEEFWQRACHEEAQLAA